MQRILVFSFIAIGLLASAAVSSENNVDDLLHKLHPRNHFDEPIHIIEDCITVESQEGHYYYKNHESKEAGQTCGIYFITDPDRNIEIELTQIDISCQSGGAISVIDGWEMSGEYFPSPQDHPLPLEERIATTCGSHASKKRYVSSQNAAVVLYDVPEKSQGFSIRVRYVNNPKPCNILVEGVSDVYTLSNHGRAVNCSVILALSPATVNLRALHIGGVHPHSGLIHKCEERGLSDYVEIGGSIGLDTSKMSVADSLCGTVSHFGNNAKAINCLTTAVRLVSSGRYHNTVKLEIRHSTEEELMDPAFSCF